jgi:hypothetical protein
VPGGGASNSGGFVNNGGSNGSAGLTGAQGGAVGNGGQTAIGAGGTAASTGGATASVAGNETGSGGNNTSSGGAVSGTGGSKTSLGGTVSGAGGNNTSSGGTSTGTGGSKTSLGGTAASTGGTAPGVGGTATRTGGAPGTGGTMTATGGGTGTGATGGWGNPVTGGPSGTGTTATVTVNPGSVVGTIGADFTGFSYEKTHIMNGSLTSNNTNMIALYKLLGSPMMRIGANDVEVCTWAGTGTAPAQPNGQPFNTKVTTGGVDQLCGFLAATGTKVIYGVNFRLGNVTASAAEAAYVMSKCPSSIVAFEIGNEPDKFGNWAAQQTQYEQFATAILAAPGALIAGPACTSGSAASFSAPFADSEETKLGSKLTVLTQHSYVAGAGSSDCSLPNLQITTSKLTDIFDTIQAAATKNKIPSWRMDENNTCSGHGQQNLSDTFISALWAVDYMFESAKRGASGVNFHNGETGMDGTVPFYYEPIKETNGVVVQVQPEYYGMLLFSQAGAGSMVSTTVTTSAQNFTAWAIKANGFTSVVLNNRNASSAVSATVNLGAAVTSASAIYLQGTPASNLTAAAGNVTIAGSQVTVAGVWNRNAPYIQAVSGNNVSVYVPAASVALVRVLP